MRQDLINRANSLEQLGREFVKQATLVKRDLLAVEADRSPRKGKLSDEKKAIVLANREKTRLGK